MKKSHIAKAVPLPKGEAMPKAKPMPKPKGNLSPEMKTAMKFGKSKGV